MDKRFLTVREASEYLNLSQDFIYQLTAAKQIHHHRFGRKILFDVNQLEAFIKERSVEPIDWPSKVRKWT